MEAVTENEKIINTLEAGKVHRYHSCPSIERKQPVSEHSFGVAAMVIFLTEGQATKEMIMEALGHDLGEVYTGDIPAPVKRANPNFKDALDKMEEEYRSKQTILPTQACHHDPELADIIKLADVIEAYLYCKKYEDSSQKVAGVFQSYLTSHMESAAKGRRTRPLLDLALLRAQHLLFPTQDMATIAKELANHAI